MVKALFDTNILIDYLNAVPQARNEFGRYEAISISVISWMEVLVGAPPEVEEATRAFLAGFGMIELDREVAERAVSLRREHGIKLPDAIIWAAADIHSLLLVTRNTKDFGEDTPGIRVPYVL
ncbi:type II toxin-antitoxin system VapC family toxin [Mesorhizobium koreense]|jgi:predicted nucleic acid-binding protein|uniref:type II toxin-antitoxin system VapC family toxin n=1 Tax=Mesorhizobium koreense TaxID=3074855 RepID=UPI00287BAAA0|nr:type II toxin-antitoxin system VapC family toxin [Mesorhizobium sp. WR6]